MIRVGIVEDDETFRSNILQSFKDNNNIDCVYNFKDAESFLKYYSNTQPISVLLVDVDLPGLNGIKLIEIISRKYPNISSVVLSIYESDSNIQKALTAGAVGYIVKGIPFEEMHSKIIRFYSFSEPPITQQVTRSLINYFQSKGYTRKIDETIGIDHRKPNFTDKEKIVIKHLLEGEPYKIIADLLSMSVNGVRYYVKMIYKKMGVNSRAQLMKTILYDKEMIEATSDNPNNI